MKAGASTIQKLLRTSVVELKFTRRRAKANAASTRRMLCTTNEVILNKLPGASVFNFTPPTQSPAYDPKQYNLVFAYDLFKQGFRAINADSVRILSVHPVSTEKERKEFWKHFNEKIRPMTRRDKERFFDK